MAAYRKWPSSRRLPRSQPLLECAHVLWVWLITAQSVSSLFANVMPGCAAQVWIWRIVLTSNVGFKAERDYRYKAWAGRFRCIHRGWLNLSRWTREMRSGLILQCWVMREWHCEKIFVVLLQGLGLPVSSERRMKQTLNILGCFTSSALHSVVIVSRINQALVHGFENWCLETWCTVMPHLWQQT